MSPARAARAARAALRPSLWSAALALTLAVLAAPAGAQRACESFERCLPLNECPALERLYRLAYSNRATAEQMKLLRRSVCQYGAQASSRPQVCCPLVPVSECGPMNTPNKIIGGNRTVVKEFPWAARLGYGSSGSDLSYQCGGSLISDRYVLTAAHCIPKGRRPVSVRLGEHDTESERDCSTVAGERLCAGPVVDVPIEDILVHPEFESSTHKPTALYNDIALLRLGRAVAFSDSVQPVCMPLRLANSKDDVGVEARPDFSLTVVGWGRISLEDEEAQDRYLAKLALRVAPPAECAPKYGKYQLNKERQMCAIGKNNTDVCSGDSGGPLTAVTLLGSKVHSVLQGVVSFGPRQCATNGTPAVFTRVSYYLPWILNAIKP